MTKENWAKQLFEAIDNSDTERFLSFLTDDALFQFGNAPAVNGKAEVGNVLNGFFGSIKSLKHADIEYWEQPDVVFCRGTVTYTRQDSTTLCVPFANILKMDNELIKEYIIYVDVSQLYQPASTT